MSIEYYKAMMQALNFYGAFKNDELLGIIAMKNKSHLTLLFTKKEHHRKGVAKALFNQMLEISEVEVITVNSSPYAVEVYHKLGFINFVKMTVDNSIYQSGNLQRYQQKWLECKEYLFHIS